VARSADGRWRTRRVAGPKSPRYVLVCMGNNVRLGRLTLTLFDFPGRFGGSSEVSESFGSLKTLFGKLSAAVPDLDFGLGLAAGRGRSSGLAESACRPRAWPAT
jgi:hypothetical protein